MNYRELLHDYFDGILDQDQEAALFSELHHREDLREELRSLFLMRKAARNEADQYMPSVDSGHAIFNRLGFASALSTQAAPSRQTATPPGRNRWEGYVQALAGGVVAALLLLLFLKIGGYSIAIIPPDKNMGADRIALGLRTDGSEGMLPNLSDGKDLTQQKKLYGTTPSLDLQGTMGNDRQPPTGRHTYGASTAHHKPLPFNPRNKGNDPDSNSRESELPHRSRAISASITKPVSLAMIDTAQTTGRTPTSTQFADVPDTTGSSENIATLTPLGVEYRRITSQNMADLPEELQGPSDIFLENSALSLTWQLNESQDIGATVGAERFYQDFTIISANGDRIRYQQNPLLYWAGITFRQQFLRSTHLNPYARLTVGGSTVGPVGRIDAGLYYQLTPVLHLFAGGELSGVVYTEAAEQHYSGKYGLTYGASFRY